MPSYLDIKEFIGKTFTAIEGMYSGNDRVTFRTADETYIMEHIQDCCESVDLYDVIGDPEDLVGTEILDAYESTSGDVPLQNFEGSCTWTFYRLSTIKGTVTLRWYGTSNGYYSESVEIYKYESGS